MLNKLIHAGLAAGIVALTAGSAGLAAEPTAGPAQAQPPAWYKHGAIVYRLHTPDAPNILPQIEESVGMMSNLLDGIPQIPILAGILGHDHLGECNWDGAWPYWNRVTFRANHSWKDLHDFMKRVKDNHNVYISFHVNLTDVNVGLKDYPETREFFQKLVKAKAIYRRDLNPETNRRDKEPPYVPTEIPAGGGPRDIFALVNYKNFWDSGLAREMIDEFYDKVPYAPPLLYLDVLNEGGGNFATGFPDGPLGGSRQTQVEGIQAIADYLRGKGTDLATEGNRPFLGKNAQGLPRASYVWKHGDGFSADDYSVISGGLPNQFVEQTFGSAGAFAAMASAEELKLVRNHYAALLAGEETVKELDAGWAWYHPPTHVGDKAVKKLPGWANLVNNFYLISIQELYHVGKGNIRVSASSGGVLILDKVILTSPAGKEIVLEAEDYYQPRRADFQQSGFVVFHPAQPPVDFKVDITEPGEYNLKLRLNATALSIYVNGEYINKEEKRRPWTDPRIPTDGGKEWPTIDFKVKLKEGTNTISVRLGPPMAEWSDGTKAVWSTPASRTGFKVWRDDIVFADDYDRMWPDTWSGKKKIYFYSWYGTHRAWKLPADWSEVPRATLYPLTPDGRGKGVPLAIQDRTISPALLPQVPYILVPETSSKGNKS